MTNDKCQMTNECQMTNFKFKNLNLGFNLDFVIWDLTLKESVRFAVGGSRLAVRGWRLARTENRRPLTEIGQATLELTVALILVMLLLVASVRIFVWLNEGMVARQASYEDTRVKAGSTPFQAVSLSDLDNAAPQSLNIGEVPFNEPLNADLNLVVQPN
jgi:hypothetical protein